MLNKRHANKYLFAYAIIVALSLILSFIFCIGKTGFHMDEMWTYSLSNTTDGFNPPISGTWQTREDLLQHFTIQDKDVYDFKMVFNNQADDVHPPFYYFIVHVFSSIAFYANVSFSKWVGLSVNFIFQLINFYLLYKICKQFPNSGPLALLSGILYGTSFATLNIMAFIRMYVMLTSCVLVTLLVHLRLLGTKTFGKKDFIVVAAVCFAGSLTQYYYLIYLFFICCFFGLKTLHRKNIRVLFSWMASIVTGLGLAVGVFPSLIEHVFFGSRATEAQQNVALFNFKDFFAKLQLFAHESWGFAAIVLLLVFLCFIVVSKRMRHTIQKSGFLSSKTLLLIGSAIAYLLVVSHIMPFNTLRYLFPAMAPFAVGISAMLIILYQYVVSSAKQNKNTRKIVFACIAVFAFASAGLSYVGDTEDIRYPAAGSNYALLNQSPTVPAVVIVGNPTWLTDMSQYIFASDTNYVVRGYNLDQVRSLRDDTRELTACYLYLDCGYDDDFQEYIITIMQQKIDTQNCELLFGSSLYNVYYIG